MRIVIIGTGVAGISFAEKLRQLSPAADITLISRENAGYYSRPLLSRGFSKADIEQSIILKSFDKIRAANIKVLTDTEVTTVDRAKQSVIYQTLGQEQSLPYDKLVLALGSAAFIPPPYRAYEKLFFCLNSLEDLKTLRQLRQQRIDQQQTPHWAIIGGGLIGCELASDLAVSGDQVHLYHVMDRLMERQLAPEDSITLLQVLQNSGVTVLLNQNVQKLTQAAPKVVVHTEDSTAFDAVIVACGFKPRTELAQQAGLTVGRGIQVNDYLQTNDQHIFALGDVAELPNGKLYAFIMPIRSQANWLAGFIAGQENQAWVPSAFTTKAKVHGFEAAQAYNL